MIALVNHAGDALIDNFGSVLVIPSPPIPPAIWVPVVASMFDPFDAGRNKEFVDSVLGVDFY